MFVFGICTTGLLFLYWKLHLMPFMPLQEAIVTEFPGSAPRVDGGQKKMHKDTPTILRIVMKSQTDPTAVDIESLRAISAVRTRVAELAKEKVQLPDLDFIELHVYKLLQEQEIRKKSFRLDVKAGAEWREVDQKGSPVTIAVESNVSTPSEFAGSSLESTPSASAEPSP